MRGRHGSDASADASSIPLPSGSPTSTSAACGRRRLAASVAVATVAASPTTESPRSSSMRTASPRKEASSSITSTEVATRVWSQVGGGEG